MYFNEINLVEYITIYYIVQQIHYNYCSTYILYYFNEFSDFANTNGATTLLN